MQRPRHPFLPALAILLLSGVVAACGVKGALEPPAAASVAPGKQAAKMDEDARRAANPAASAKSVFYESSTITGVSRHDEVIPKLPPKEWERKREVQPKRDARTVTPGAHQLKPAPDKAFFLDWLL